MKDTVTKRGRARELQWEAAGLRWLAAAKAVLICRVERLTDAELVLERIASGRPDRAAAERFGRELAAMHATADGPFGLAPGGWTGDGYLGPGDDLLPLRLVPSESWGRSYAAQLRGIATVATERGRLDSSAAGLVERVCARLDNGDFDDGVSPARVHGDLWSGNVLWSPDGVVLIDPAAHVGHPQLDLAMLELFGAPHLETVLGSYAEAAALPSDWRERTGLHRLLHLLVHVACFGGSYVGQTVAELRRWA